MGLFLFLAMLPLAALERPGVTFKVFQFPANQIPRIDGKTDDWAMVPASYAIGIDQLKDTVNNTPMDKKDLDVTVKAGWVKGLNRLYFLYEAYDNYWDFRHRDLHNDIFELVVDGDLSGFKPGESGKLVLEFFITPFDHAAAEGPERSVESKLWENKVIGMSWPVLDYDDEKGTKYRGFWNLSHKTTMYGNAPDLVAFRLMPIESGLRRAVEADWSFSVIDMDHRMVGFKDLSYGPVTSWLWEFGDGKTSTERHPQHSYERPGTYVVTLTVDGPKGKDRRTKVWDAVLR
ncbi:MAG: PKD domain-containing protein [Acidobacteria bacterium]|nr:PKD domain-containing protein [Acidobacteriota bacterium]